MKLIQKDANFFSKFINSINFVTLFKKLLFLMNLELPGAPVHKEYDKCSLSNYHPITILPNLLKFSKKNLYGQMTHFVDKIYFKILIQC